MKRRILSFVVLTAMLFSCVGVFAEEEGAVFDTEETGEVTVSDEVSEDESGSTDGDATTDEGVTISAVRELDAGTEVTVTGVASRKVDGYWYIQDSDAGIAVSTENSIASGDVLTVSGTLGLDDGIVYVEENGLEVLSTDNDAPKAIEATIPQIAGGEYQGMLVNIIGSKIVSMDSQNITIRDNNEDIRIQIVNYAALNPGIINNSKIDVVAIATARADNFILRPQVTEDITVSVVPQEISTEEELDAVRNNMYGNYILTNDIELSKYWVPIGTASNPFCGTFDGNGYTIYDMEIQNDLEYWSQYAGFFGYAKNANFRNIRVIGKADTSIQARTTSGSSYAGGVVAYLNGGVIDNCYFDGEITLGNYVGGIAGEVRNATVSNCTDIDVAIDIQSGSTNVGGIAGTAYDSTIYGCDTAGYISAPSSIGGIVSVASNLDIYECSSIVDMSGAGTTGGILGYATGTVDVANCYAKGDINATGVHTGGLVGLNEATLTVNDCSAECNITSSYDNVGGLIGYTSGRTTIKDSYSVSYVLGNNQVGGLVGYNEHSYINIDNCYAAANNSYSTASVSGNQNVGGLIGLKVPGDRNTGGDITNSYVKGSVFASGNYAGGFIGNIYYPYYSTVNISNCYTTASVKGAEYVGGFIGDSTHNSYGEINVTNCYAKDGKIVGTNYIGGFIGRQSESTNISYCYASNEITAINNTGSFGSVYWNKNKITRCYYNSESSPLCSDSVAVGKTEEQLENQKTYLDWDFANIWAVDTSVNDGLPYLQNMVNTLEEGIEPIEISTEEELNNIRYNIYGSYKLTANIELTEPWEPMTFYGTLDGNGYEISNLELVNYNEYNYSRGALIKYLGVDGVIKNLKVSGTAEKGSLTGTALLVGSNIGTIVNCHTAGTVNGGENTGGLVGQNWGTIKNSSSEAEVKGDGSIAVGGFVGWNNGVIRDCYATGNVSNSGNYVGGFSGGARNGARMISCYATGDVTGTDNVGGFLGYVGDSGSVYLDNCYTTGKVKGNNQVGGLVGYNERSYINIDNSYSTASVSGNQNVGGLIGLKVPGDRNTGGDITNSYVTGSVFASGNYAGGFIGNIYYPYYSTVNISNCYTTASVKGAEYVGGFIGDSTHNSYGEINVTNCYAKDGKIVGTNYIGGFIGRQSESTNIRYCYASNEINLVNTYGSFAAVYGDKNKINRCYYNSETNAINKYLVEVGKTAEELKDAKTYLDWDFANVWNIETNKNGGFPYLRNTVAGEQTEEEEYTLITNEQELINIRYNLTGKFKLANDITLSYNWIPIGSGTMSGGFDGILDGDGHTIYGFNIPQNEEYEFTYAAMFASTGSNAVIKNLNIVATENGGSKTLRSGKYAAGLVVNNYGKIENCSYTGIVNCGDDKGGIAVNNYNTIENCFANVTISGSGDSGGIVCNNYGRVANSTASGKLTGANYLGGIAAYNQNMIIGCRTENMTINGTSTGSSGCTGGIAGYTTSNILNCTVESSTINNNAQDTGGIAGYADGTLTIYGCTTDCEINGKIEVGGIVGNSDNDYVTVQNCHSSSRVTGTDRVGGIYGYINSYATVTDCTSSGTVSGARDVGGLIGKMEGVTLRYSSSSAQVIANGTGHLFGGAIGYMLNSSSATDCYATGNVIGYNGINNCIGGFVGANESPITRCYATGSVVGNNFVGGFAGENRAKTTYAYARGRAVGNDYVGGFAGRNTSEIQFTYSTGAVNAMGDNAGGFAGGNTNSILNSYYNKETSGKNDTGKGIPKSTFELMQQMNYISWDYDTIWNMDAALNNNYPYLRSIGAAQSGVVGEAIEIYTEQDLRNIANNLNANYVLKNNIALSENWEPLGDFDSRFNGTFDGGGFTISNVNIPSNEGAFVGFFGIISSSATVKNLTIEISESGSISALSSVSYTGGLAAQSYGTISNCFVSGKVLGQNNVGGLVGENYGVISVSASKGEVSGSGTVGGLTGLNAYIVENSYSTANVTGDTNAGGLAGSNSGRISESYAKGNTVGRAGSKFIGGLVGVNSGTVTKSSAQNTVSGTDNVGGFVGKNNGVVSNSSASSVVSGNGYIGGFVGYNDTSTISNCYAIGNADGASNYVGGFVGYNRATLTNCYAAVSVKGTNPSYTGGFSGYKSGTFTSCYFDNIIAGTTATAGGTGYNTTYMYTPSTYSGWDFDNTWKFDDTVPGYPYLAWQSGIGKAPSVIPASGIVINAPKTTFGVGEAVTLTATLTPGTATDNVIWSSSDSQVATINSRGVLVAMRAGSATITAKAGIAEATVEITVSNQQINGNIVSVSKINDIYVPYATTLENAKAELPETVDVVLDNATSISVSVEWQYVADTAFEFIGTLVPSGAVTNTDDIKANATVIVNPEITEPGKINEFAPIEVSVSYGTNFDAVFAMLPESVQATLSNGNTVTLLVAWDSYSDPVYDSYTSGDYIISGNPVLPTDGSVVNSEGLAVTAKITVEAMPEQVRNVTGAVYNEPIEVAYGTNLETAKSLLPKYVYAVVEGPVTVSLPVTWSIDSAPSYDKFAAADYTFTGTFLMPENGKVTNTDNVKTTIAVKVLPSEVDSKNMYITDIVAEKGGVGEISVFIEENTNMSTGSFCISFDNSKLTPIAYEIGDVIGNASTMVNMNYIDELTGTRVVKVSFMGSEAIAKGGEVIKIKYLISESAADNESIPVTVTNLIISDITETPLPINIIDGSITALDVIMGDINGDGQVNIMDSLRILRFDVGFITELTSREQIAGDVNKDGEVALEDAILIQRVDIGLDTGFGN